MVFFKDNLFSEWNDPFLNFLTELALPNLNEDHIQRLEFPVIHITASHVYTGHGLLEIHGLRHQAIRYGDYIIGLFHRESRMLMPYVNSIGRYFKMHIDAEYEITGVSYEVDDLIELFFHKIKPNNDYKLINVN